MQRVALPLGSLIAKASLQVPPQYMCNTKFVSFFLIVLTDFLTELANATTSHCNIDAICGKVCPSL